LVSISAKTNPVRDFMDYEVQVPNQSQMPSGITILEKL